MAEFNFYHTLLVWARKMCIRAFAILEWTLCESLWCLRQTSACPPALDYFLIYALNNRVCFRVSRPDYPSISEHPLRRIFPLHRLFIEQLRACNSFSLNPPDPPSNFLLHSIRSFSHERAQLHFNVAKFLWANRIFTRIILQGISNWKCHSFFSWSRAIISQISDTNWACIFL